jgi:hypothetical protein
LIIIISEHAHKNNVSWPAHSVFPFLMIQYGDSSLSNFKNTPGILMRTRTPKKEELLKHGELS